MLYILFLDVDSDYDGWEDDSQPQRFVPSDGVLMLTCNKSSECESNQICVNGVCTIKCKTDADCASYQVLGASALNKI